jgi:hypothetical protein
VKGKSILYIFIVLILTVTSCQKEKQVSILGEWEMAAVLASPSEGWVYESNQNAYLETISLNANNRFTVSTDVPGRSGTYTYNRSEGLLYLFAEADAYNAVSTTDTVKVELITDTKLVLVQEINASGMLFKKEYIRAH